MCTCGTNFDVVIVRDMSDKADVMRQWPEHDHAKFVFLKDAELWLTGWTPEHIYFSVWCMESSAFESISPMLSHRKAQGSRVICLGS